MKTEEISTRRLTKTMLAGISALLFVMGLSLLLSHFHVQAQPAAEPSAPILDVQKEANTDVAMPGDTLAYTVTVNNTGDAAASVLLTDQIASELTCITASLGANYGAPVLAGDVISWSGSVGVDQTARIWFNAQILSDTTASAIENTAYVTGAGQLVTDAWTTTVVSGQLHSQIRSPNMDAYITEKGSLTISGIAWREGLDPPYLTDDPQLSLQRLDERSFYVDWTDVVSAENYTLQEATQPDFADQTSEVIAAPTTQSLISKDASEDGVYYYRVQASRLGLSPSRWSNVESVTVPWTTASMASAAAVAANGPLTVQVRMSETDNIEASAWHNAVVTPTSWDGWDWSYDWSLPEAKNTQYAIQTRAGEEDGNWGPVDTVTVTLDNEIYTMIFPLIFRRWPPINYPPALTVEGKEDDQDDDYTLAWTYSDDNANIPDPSSYTLQEATNADFSDAADIYEGSNESYDITGQEDGTYYYRVRGHNTYGPGEWSNVESVTVRGQTYHYDFSQSKIKPAWPIRRASIYDGAGKDWGAWTEEQDGYLFAVINNKYDFAIGSPWEQAPDPPYIIETKVKYRDPSNLVAYGVIFGGNDGSPCPAYREDGCLTHYYRLEVIWFGGGLKAQLKRIDYHESDKGHGRGESLTDFRDLPGDTSDWHKWVFVVKPDGIDIYLDDDWWDSTDDDKYVDDPYFGVYVSANEYDPAIGQYSYYYVDPE